MLVPNANAVIRFFERFLGVFELFICWFNLDLIAEQEYLPNQP
jgi:hypothetical protein